MRLSARRHVHLGAAAAHGADGVHDHLKVALLGRESKGLGILRIAGDHERLAVVRQGLPDLLGDERHERVQELENVRQDIQQHLLRAAGAGLVAAVEAGLRELDIPVAVRVPDEVVDLRRGDADLVLVEVLAHFLRERVELREYPLVLELQRLGQLVFVDGEVHHHEARCVPELVGKVAHGAALLNVKAHVVAGAVARDEVEAQSVGAVGIGHLERVDAVSERLGHLAALIVADQTVDEHRRERDVLHLLEAGEDHARDPEEDDVVARDHDARGIPELQVLRVFIRPAERGKRPERGAEPGVEHVGVAVDVLAVAGLALAGVGARDGDMATVVAVPRRDLVAPPELAGDAPVVHILHPVIIGLAEALGHELDAPVAHGLDGGLGQRLHLDEPLRARHRLDRRAAAVARADIMIIRLGLDEVALLLEIGQDGLARLVAVEAVILAAVDDAGILVEDEDLLEIMAQADLVVVRVVAGRHLDAAGAEIELDIIIGHDGQLAAHERQDGRLADEVLVALVRRVDRDAGVAEHGLRTGGGDGEIVVAVLERVADIPERAGHVLIFDLGVRQGRAAVRAPVDDAVALVDQALFVQLAERLAHGLRAALVHGEAAAVPVAGHAERLLLLDDAVAVLLFPRPDALQKRIAAEIVAGQSLFLAQHLLDLDLRGDAGMVRAGHPQGGIALHALIAREDVLQRRVKRVAHVQLAGDVRGRHDDGKRLFVRIGFTGKVAAAHPHVINLALDLFGIVDLRKLFHGSSSFKIAGAQKNRPETNCFRAIETAVPPEFHADA